MSQNIEDNRKQWPGASQNFTVGKKQVDGSKVWEPGTDYPIGGEYMKVHATTYRSGQSIEVDETKGGERIRVINTDGSYMEMQHDGTFIHRSAGNSHEVVVKDKNVKVKGALHVSIEGDANIKVMGDAYAEVVGKLDATIGSTTHVKSGGDMTIETPNLIIKGNTVSHNGINIGFDHEHTNVTPGGGISGPPLPL